VIVLHAEQGEAVDALGPELGDVAPAEHIAIHEDRRALVAHHVSHKIAGKREGCASLGVSLSPIEAFSLQLWGYQGGDR